MLPQHASAADAVAYAPPAGTLLQPGDQQITFEIGPVQTDRRGASKSTKSITFVNHGTDTDFAWSANPTPGQWPRLLHGQRGTGPCELVVWEIRFPDASTGSFFSGGSAFYVDGCNHANGPPPPTFTVNGVPNPAVVSCLGPAIDLLIGPTSDTPAVLGGHCVGRCFRCHDVLVAAGARPNTPRLRELGHVHGHGGWNLCDRRTYTVHVAVTMGDPCGSQDPQNPLQLWASAKCAPTRATLM